MKIPRYVFKKPFFLNIIPVLGKQTANTFGPFILLPEFVYEDLKLSNPQPQHIALLIHEETHRAREKEIGFLKFGMKYLFDKKFRFNEELIAVKRSMKYLKKNKIPFDFDEEAKFLSSNLYLFPVSKKYTKEELEKIWNEI